MKKTFKLQDLDCANCAAKMETAISKIEGVKSASISFMAQKLTIEAERPKFRRRNLYLLSSQTIYHHHALQLQSILINSN